MALSTRSTSRPTVGVTRVRQGRLGRNILWVLIAALLLVVLGFFATWTWKARDLANAPNQGRAPASAAQTFNAPPPRAAVRQNYEKGAPYAPQNGGNPGSQAGQSSPSPQP
jgi:hypothetical protein